MQTTPAHIKEVDNLIASIRLTNAELLQLKQMDAQHYVCEMFGWDEDDYGAQMLDAGAAYLKVYCQRLPGLDVKMAKCESFWQWWCNHYGNRNIQFMHWDCTQVDCTLWLQYYRDLHNPNILAQHIYPGAAVWNEIKRKAL